MEISEEIIEEIILEFRKSGLAGHYSTDEIRKAIKLAYKKGQEDMETKQDDIGFQLGYEKAIDDLTEQLKKKHGQKYILSAIDILKILEKFKRN